MNPAHDQAEQASPVLGAAPFRIPHSALRIPELLAPAGDWECARAAVENGADAIYFGLENFNARMRAQNFTSADLPALMEFLHRRGMRGYVSFNTLVFPNEVAEAERSLRTIIAAGVDAAIVQDVGICRLIRRLSPDFPIHASTQMTITSPAGVEFVRELGCQLVVLARECSVKEIAQIQARQTSSALRIPHSTLDLEVFVHGALCVAYSGQCLTSEALGGRSANRGVCAQACRMPYDLLADGKPVPLGDRRYLLSPQDLVGVEILPELIRLGVASLKIEGRLKSPEYVANITRVYRQAIDRLVAEMTPPVAGTRSTASVDSEADGSAKELARSLLDSSRYDLEMAFSRGLYTGWFGGINNQELVHGRFGKKRGVYLGEVSHVGRDHVSLKLEGPLKPGDGVVFDAGRPDLEEEGGRVYEVRSSKFEVRSSKEARSPKAEDGRRKAEGQAAAETRLTFGQGDIDFSRIHVGDKVWKTSDPELERRLRQSFAGDQPRFQQPIDLNVRGRAGEPLTLRAADEWGHVATVSSAMPLAVATKQPLTEARLREQLGRLGGTAFRLGALKVELPSDVMLPISELNRLRRDVVGQIEALRARPKRWTLVEGGTRNAECGTSAERGVRNAERGTSLELGTRSAERGMRAEKPAGAVGQAPLGKSELIVLVRSLDQMDAALRCGVQTLYSELEDPKRYREAVQRFREWQDQFESSATPATPSTRQSEIRNPKSEIPNASLVPRPSSLFVAPPRIAKPGEEWILEQVRSCGADGYLVRNYDHLECFPGARLIGDYSLNVANALTAEHFLERYGLERVTASYDLNHAQLVDLLHSAPPDWFEITIHQHMPLFHMEHCVFCAFLTNGTDYRNCGRPCDRRVVELQDRVGARHPVKADAGCRNTVFNALAQTGAEHVASFIAAGARRFRVEFLNETPEQVELTIRRYQQLLEGGITGAQLWRELKLFNQLGVTRGPMG
jgi:putative protease